MKLIIINDNGSRHRKIKISFFSILGMMLIASLLILALFNISKYMSDDVISSNEIRLLNKFDSILLKAADLDAQVKRINSLGKALAVKSNIDINTYFLSQAPAMGGLGNINSSSSIVTQANLARSIEDLELELELQEERYKRIGSFQKKPISTTANITPKLSTNEDVTPPSYVMPVNTGYVSSAFGRRRDPINGHQRHHNGIDIAAKHGSKISTIASGFVTFAGRKGGYGNVIDIHHSDSLKSRYAHLDTINVKQGEVVRKGDTIATMGQTGRATGAHLHLEVWENNKPVNPESYINVALIK